MPIQFHPKPGSILICNFDGTFKPPEMIKRRPVVVLSPQIASRPNLCTVVAISSEEPKIKLQFHCELAVVLPHPWSEGPNWVKGDMIYSVGFHRLDLIKEGRGASGKRIYDTVQLSADEFRKVRKCVLNGLGLSTLTKHLP